MSRAAEQRIFKRNDLGTFCFIRKAFFSVILAVKLKSKESISCRDDLKNFWFLSSTFLSLSCFCPESHRDLLCDPASSSPVAQRLYCFASFTSSRVLSVRYMLLQETFCNNKTLSLAALSMATRKSRRQKNVISIISLCCLSVCLPLPMLESR